MIQIRSADAGAQPVPVKIAPSKPAIVEGLATHIRNMGARGVAVDHESLFLEAGSQYKLSEIREHFEEARDRAIDLARESEAYRRVA